MTVIYKYFHHLFNRKKELKLTKEMSLSELYSDILCASSKDTERNLPELLNNLEKQMSDQIKKLKGKSILI